MIMNSNIVYGGGGSAAMQCHQNIGGNTTMVSSATTNAAAAAAAAAAASSHHSNLLNARNHLSSEFHQQPLMAQIPYSIHCLIARSEQSKKFRNR